MLFMILTEKKLLELFTKKNFKKQIKKDLVSKKYSRENVINHMLNGKVMIVHLIFG